jgi:hypothetical protein
MILRRLIAWLTGRRAAAVRIAPPAPSKPADGLAPAEFARLLRSGDPDDLKKLARALSRPVDKLKP